MNFLHMKALEDTDQNATVEVAPRELVSWKVYFVDEESRQIQLSAMLQWNDFRG